MRGFALHLLIFFFLGDRATICPPIFLVTFFKVLIFEYFGALKDPGFTIVFLLTLPSKKFALYAYRQYK